MIIRNARLAIAIAAALVAATAGADTYTDNFQGDKAANQWIALGDACLTAGTQTGASGESNPIIPSCASKNSRYPTDAPNQGALMLTPAENSQTGAILSGFTFPMSQGLQVTFTTYSFGSMSNGAPAYIGADGIAFFLTDGTQPVPADTGATGGAMGYGCSWTNTGSGKKWNGIENGYLGLGMDEWGNFLNSGDNSGDGVLNTNASGAPSGHGGNTWQSNVGGGPGDGSGREYQPNRIGMRGAGNVNFKWLHSLNPDYYSTDNGAKVATACHTGRYLATGTNTSIAANFKPIDHDYYAIPGAYRALPNNQPLADVKAQKREDSWPVTYKITISPAGLLNFSYSYNNGDFQPVLTNQDISKINGVPPASFRFGFSAGTGGQNNVHEITCFQASPLESQSSAGANTETGKVVGDVQFFLASYSINNWWGSLIAAPLLLDGDTLSVGTVANWDAKCVLTGAAPCDTMSKRDPVTGKVTETHDVAVQSPEDRTLLTSSGTDVRTGVTLEWANLDQAQKDALGVATTNAQDATPGQNRVAWLRGDRAVEQLAEGCTSTPAATPPCDTRVRTYLLGDIINSSPTFVGAPGAGAQPDVFVDKLVGTDPNPENAKDAMKYSAYATGNAGRTNVVYVGSNDGYVHGFRAGSTSKDGFDPTDNDGRELVGYMPYDVLLERAVNLADPSYSHDYLVDATPVAGDVFYAGTWHTWLVGGVGSRGKEIYALDVSNPDSMSAANVIGDWDNASTELNDTAGVNHLGNTVGTPVIARMHNGQWAILFGSGLVPPPADGAPAAPTEGVYIGLIDSVTGAVKFRFLDTGVAPAATASCAAPNGGDAPKVVCQGGIAYVSQADLDNDGIADYLYAGDTQGNVWRFDVTSGKEGDWRVSKFGTADPAPLFVARDAANHRQPITTAILPLSVQTGLVARAMLYFGTGQQTPQSATAALQYSTGQQTFYGIWDWNMDDWNDKAPTAKYASLAAPQTFTRAQLRAQAVGALTDTAHRYLSNKEVVCWKGDPPSSGCTAQNQHGWMFDLPDQGQSTGPFQGQREQTIYNPTLIGGAVIVNSAIPPITSAAQCKADQQGGWTMAFDPATGGGFMEGFFPDAGGGFNSTGGSSVGGVMLSGVGTPSALQFGGNSYLVTQTITGAAKIIGINPPSEDNPSRVSWRELVSP